LESDQDMQCSMSGLDTSTVKVTAKELMPMSSGGANTLVSMRQF